MRFIDTLVLRHASFSETQLLCVSLGESANVRGYIWSHWQGLATGSNCDKSLLTQMSCGFGPPTTRLYFRVVFLSLSFSISLAQFLSALANCSPCLCQCLISVCVSSSAGQYLTWLNGIGLQTNSSAPSQHTPPTRWVSKRWIADRGVYRTRLCINQTTLLEYCRTHQTSKNIARLILG